MWSALITWIRSLWDSATNIIGLAWEACWVWLASMWEAGLDWATQRVGPLYQWGQLHFSDFTAVYDVVGYFIPWKYYLGIISGILVIVAGIRFTRWIKSFIPTVSA